MFPYMQAQGMNSSCIYILKKIIIQSACVQNVTNGRVLDEKS